MAVKGIGCGRPTGSSVGEAVPEKDITKEQISKKEDSAMSIARVAGKAPDFTAPAFHEGTFKEIKLSDYLGKWVLLCFYPGDFTFV